MFKGFNIDKFKRMKPPSDNSFNTMQEVKQLNSIPMNKSSVQKYDNIEKTFADIAAKNNITNYDSKLVGDLIKKSAPIITKLKKHFNRPRPKVMAKKLGIRMADYEMNSMKTPSYPSGHSTQGVLIGKVLADKYPKAAKQFIRAGKNISDSRRIAKAHYKSDSKMGEMLGNEMYKHTKASPLKCWKGYERVPGTAKGSKGSCRKSSPMKKQKGGGTTKTCLPAAKIRGMSKEKRQELVSSKKAAGAQGKYKRSSKTNVKGARKKGATLRDWVQKEDWRRVDDPSKKCGE